MSKRKPAIAVVGLAVAFVACIGAGAGAAWWFYSQSNQGDTGSYVIPKGGMSDGEAQALVDEMAEKSRITVSMAPRMLLREDGTLRTNFIVAEQNNGFSERFELEQGGNVIYRSGVVNPGNGIEWAQPEGAREGGATATVYAVSDGVDSGNPISVEIEIAKERGSQ